jgi:hypothetical protein|tara:strand:- start:1449 stop:2207 length:759 start_codon:yes stop_codon:yes gene_type:complete
MQQETSNKVAKKESNLPSSSLFIQDAGMGLENMDKDDLALPFLKLLQSSSDETKKKHANYVEGAEAGMFYNTVTKKLYDGEKGIEVIPCFYKLTFPEWAPFERKEGRPVNPDRGAEVLSQTKKNDKNQDILPNGNLIIKTANHFVVINGPRPEKALMAMKSTQLKVSRGWNSLIKDEFEMDNNKAVPAPSFSRIYRLKSVENTGSFTWHGYSIDLLRKVDNTAVYQMAKEFHSSLKKSNAKAVAAQEEKAPF